MDLTHRLQQVCRVTLPTVMDQAIKNELQLCADWVEKFGCEGDSLTVETLIEACLKRLESDIQQPVRDLLLDLLKILYQERDKSQPEQSTATVEEVPDEEPQPSNEQTPDPATVVIEMTEAEWREAWHKNVQHVEELHASYMRFKAGITIATARTQELAQRPNPPESTEKVEQALEDVTARITAITTTVTIKKQQREEQRCQAALKAAQEAARASVQAAQKARSECERQFQLARDELLKVGLNSDEEIHGKEMHCYFCGLKGYRARYFPRRADHGQYRRTETLYGTHWIRTYTA